MKTVLSLGNVVRCFLSITYALKLHISCLLILGTDAFEKWGKEPGFVRGLSEPEDTAPESITVNPRVDRPFPLVVYHTEILSEEAHVGDQNVVPSVYHLPVSHLSPPEVDDDGSTGTEVVFDLLERWTVHSENVEVPTSLTAEREVKLFVKGAFGMSITFAKARKAGKVALHGGRNTSPLERVENGYGAAAESVTLLRIPGTVHRGP